MAIARSDLRDNGDMPTISSGFVHQAQLRDEVAQAANSLASLDVRDVQFRLGTDSSGERPSSSESSLPLTGAKNPALPR